MCKHRKILAGRSDRFILTFKLLRFAGVGYQLKITKNRDTVPRKASRAKDTSAVRTKNAVIVDLITKNVPEAKVESLSPTEIEMTLPLSKTDKFAAMFKALESRQTAYNIKHIGVSCTTMEQVFLKCVALAYG